MANKPNYINTLAGNPNTYCTVTKQEAQEIMKETNGQLLACGSLYEIILSPLGADMYRITLGLWYERAKARGELK